MKLIHCIFALLILVVDVSALHAARPLDQVLPANTRLFLHIPHWDDATEKFRSTQLGMLWNSNAMQAFRQELNNQGRSLEGFLKREYGLDFDLLEEHAHQEFAVAGMETANGTLSLSFFFRLDDADTAGEQLVRQAGANLIALGGRKSQQQLSIPATVYETGEEGEQVVFVMLGEYFVISGDVLIAENLVNRWNSAESIDSLAEFEAYRQVMEQTRDKKPSDVQWFVDLINLAVAAEKKSTPEQKKDDQRPPFPLRHGFPGIQGIGGRIWLGGETEELEHIAIYAPPPRELALLALDFASGDATPPSFVPGDASTCSVVHWKLESLINNMGDVYDDITDAPGAFDETINDLRAELNVDLPSAMFPLLGPKMTLMSVSNPEMKIERSLTAISIRDPSKQNDVAAMIYRLLVEDDNVRRRRLPGHEHDLWIMRLKVGDAETSYSQAGVMVADGHLWISTHASLVEEVVMQSKPPLAEDPLYLQVQQHWPSASEASVNQYTRTDLDLRVTYETLRNDGIEGLEDVENIYGSILLRFLEESEEDVDIDFSTLPPFEEVAPFLGVNLMTLNNWQHGWTVRSGVFNRNKFSTSSQAADLSLTTPDEQHE